MTLNRITLVHVAALCLVCTVTHAAAPSLPATLASPDQRIKVEFKLTAKGEPRYSVQLSGKRVLNDSRLGVVRDDADFTQGLQLIDASAATAVHDEYELLTSKRRLNRYSANRSCSL